MKKASGYLLAIYLTAVVTKAFSEEGAALGFVMLAILTTPALLGYFVGRNSR